MTSVVFRKALLVLLVAWFCIRLYVENYDRLNRQKCRFRPDADVKLMVFGDPQIPGSRNVSLRKRLDVFGNDHYLGHVYKVLRSHANPNQVAVMGDLLSSQWIDDEEFYSRVDRYSNRIFPHSNDIELFNVSGNHDVGYSGEMTVERISRYEHAFGKVNFVRDFGDWRIVCINSLSLDGPQYDTQFNKQTLEFLDQLSPSENPTVLLTHVPLHKESGVCSDGPLFRYYEWGTLKEQNHLSEEVSNRVLNAVFPPGSGGGVVVAGHDHEGCQASYVRTSDKEWAAKVFDATEQGAIQEYTVRSMMGAYGGNGGLLEGTRTADGSWSFEFKLCPFAVQHIWWVSKVLDVMVHSFLALYTIVRITELVRHRPRPRAKIEKAD
uniref:ARAD1B08492p n=1 Tax=Blastobotrys adeninivorans TaxID=409370 RepID=A0A060T652_BLAAD